jgi:hypothetical protein
MLAASSIFLIHLSLQAAATRSDRLPIVVVSEENGRKNHKTTLFFEIRLSASMKATSFYM